MLAADKLSGEELGGGGGGGGGHRDQWGERRGTGTIFGEGGHSDHWGGGGCLPCFV